MGSPSSREFNVQIHKKSPKGMGNSLGERTDKALKVQEGKLERL